MGSTSDNRVKVCQTGVNDVQEYECATKLVENLRVVLDPEEMAEVQLNLNKTLLMTKVSQKSKKRIELIAKFASLSFCYRQVSKNKFHEFKVDDIRQIIDRDLARHYREELGLAQECERRWISISYLNHDKQRLKCLHLVADTSHDLKRLVSTIQNFKDLKASILGSYLTDLSDLTAVKRAIILDNRILSDKAKKQLLCYEDILKYCRRLDINMDSAKLLQLFNKSKNSKQDGLDFDDFKCFVKFLRHREDLSKLWKEVTNQSKVMNIEQFTTFMLNTQMEDLEVDGLHKVFKRFCSNECETWTSEDFNRFLNSKYLFCLNDLEKEEGYYSHSLNDYFILSSHNTYLVGRQVAGESSVAGYIRALQRGCRCVEIDLWNSGTPDSTEPIVNHGRTFTSGIKFSDVLHTIKKYAFQTSSLPVILSLEIHCSVEAQIKAVETLKRVFGPMLVFDPETGGNKLPSPETLRNRVLLKVKKTNSQDISIDDNGSFTTTSTTGNSFSESGESSSRTSSSKSLQKIRKKKVNRITEKLSDLGVYCQGLKFRNFSLPESKTFNHCFSLSEKAMNSMLKDPTKAAAVEKHNRRFLMRIYPSKFRLSSSNFLPINYWAHGAQMVATNWQNYDLGQQLNEGLFDSVSGSGYVLKPFDLRRPSLKSTMRKQLKQSFKTTKFKFTIISAQQLHKPQSIDGLNPYVSLSIIGARAVTWKEKQTGLNTKIVAGNGFNPIWNELFSGSFTCDYDLVFLRVLVQSSSSTVEIENPKEIGLALFNVFHLKKGYRYLRLKDFCGEQLLHSTLFVKIEVDTV